MNVCRNHFLSTYEYVKHLTAETFRTSLASLHMLGPYLW